MLFPSPHDRAGDAATATGTAGSDWAAFYTFGVHMPKRLGDDDGRAVDLLLDKTAIAGQTTMYAAPGKDGFDRRVNSVAGLLRLLEQMPAADPPADLTARTLQRIEQRRYQPPVPANPAVHPSVQLDPRRPM